MAKDNNDAPMVITTPRKMIHPKDGTEAYPKDKADVEALRNVGFVEDKI